MNSVTVMDEPCDDTGPEPFDIAAYTRGIFGMYSGEVVKAELSFDPSLLNAVLDRFGNVRVTEEAGGWVTVCVEVSASPVFLGWMFQFGDRAKILSPDSLVDAMKAHIADVLRRY
jgi:predicted DNA-binding transcriptional regulator YafY